MTERLTPHLPFAPDETFLSWITRLAAFHTGGRLVPFLRDLGIQRFEDVLGGANGTINRICAVTGEPPELVMPNALLRQSPRTYQLRGETFSAEFLRGRLTAFCPACLAEDATGSGNAPARWRGRLAWAVRPVHVCPTHKIALVERSRGSWDDITHELSAIVTEDHRGLLALAEGAPRRVTSPLQDYVLARLDGAEGPPWLDGQRIDQAVRATEMLGVLFSHGRKAKVGEFSTEDWDEAGRAGWNWTSRGEEGVRAALEDLQRNADDVPPNAGLKLVFGSLYRWLAVASRGREPGPILPLLRDHVLDNMPIAPGTALLGEVVAARRRHTVPSLAAETGLHPHTLQNFLETHGVVPARRGVRLGILPTFDAAEGQRLAEMLRHAVAAGDLTRLLNASRSQVLMLIRLGFLPQLHDGHCQRSRSSRLVDGRAVAEVLERIDTVTHQVDELPCGVFNLGSAAKAARVNLEEILPRLFRGELARAFRLKGACGLSAVHLDPEELKPLAPPPLVGQSLYETWVALSVTTAIGQFLIAEREGGPFLRTTKVPSPRTGNLFDRVLPEDLALFRSTYATQAHLCREAGLHHQEVRRRMDALGIRPVVDPEAAGVRLYRRRDIPPDWAR